MIGFGHPFVNGGNTAIEANGLPVFSLCLISDCLIGLLVGACVLAPSDSACRQLFFFSRPQVFAGAKGELIQDNTVQKKWRASSEGRRMRNTSRLRRNSHLWGVLSMTMEHYQMWCRETKVKLQEFGLIPVRANDSPAIATLEEQSKARQYLGKVAAALLNASKREAEILENSTARFGIPYFLVNHTHDIPAPKTAAAQSVTSL